MLVRGHMAAPGWYQAGREALTLGDILIAARLVLYVFATLSILLMFLFSFPALGPFVGGCHVCRNVFTMATVEVPCGADVFIRMSVTLAHSCLNGVRFR